MRTQTILFKNQKTICVFPDDRTHLAKAMSELRLQGSYPVIVLIGGEIDAQHAEATQLALETIAKTAESLHLVIVSGGTNMGVMAAIGQIREQNHYKFPLIGIAPEDLVTWPGGPRGTKFLWWGKQRWQLESHYSHFLLVPGSHFGDESPWIVDAATLLSKGRKSATILLNGGEVSRQDIQLSLSIGRPTIALSRTGRLADEIARDPNRDKAITVIPANAEKQIVEALRVALSNNDNQAATPSIFNTKSIPVG